VDSADFRGGNRNGDTFPDADSPQHCRVPEFSVSPAAIAENKP
jgi:hypothetical protein